MKTKTIHRWAGSFAISILLVTPTSAQPAPAGNLTLARALEFSHRHSPTLQAAQHRLEERKGELTTASVVLRKNPGIGAMLGHRSGSQSASNPEFQIGITQSFEIGGQRGHRIGGAKARVHASESEWLDVLRSTDLAIAESFFAALAAQKLVALRTEGEELSERLFDVAVKRLERGAGIPLDVNAARIRRAEAKRGLLVAHTQSQSAIVKLRLLIGMPRDQNILLQGDLSVSEISPIAESVLDQVIQARPDLLAAKSQVQAARADTKLEASKVWPDVSARLRYGQEEGTSVVMAGVRFDLPVFNRNTGQKQRSRAALKTQMAQVQIHERAIASEIELVWLQYQQALDALKLYDAEVVQAQEESLSLLQGAFTAGDVGIPAVIIVQREVLESREAYLNVRLTLALARAALLAATAQEQTTTGEQK